jgi:hypothetical protein
MYDLPGKDTVLKCIITEEAVRRGASPDLIEGEPAPAPQKRRQFQTSPKGRPEEPNVS